MFSAGPDQPQRYFSKASVKQVALFRCGELPFGPSPAGPARRLLRAPGLCQVKRSGDILARIKAVVKLLSLHKVPLVLNSLHFQGCLPRLVALE